MAFLLLPLPRSGCLLFIEISSDRPPHLPHGHRHQRVLDLPPLVVRALRLRVQVVLIDNPEAMLLVQWNPVDCCVEPHLHPHLVRFPDPPFHYHGTRTPAPVVGMREDDVEIYVPD